MRRVLITGSRTWVREETIRAALQKCISYWGTDIVVVHGGARGADIMAANIAGAHFLQIEPHYAQWGEYGKRAGYVRNAEMVALDADICLAFVIDNSPGTTMMIKLVEKANIPIMVFREFTGS